MDPAHPTVTARRQRALDAFLAGLRAADPGPAVRRALRADGPSVELRGARGWRSYRPTRLEVIAFGKAALPMAEAALAVLDARLERPALVVVPHGAERELASAEVRPARHPLPDEHGLRAAEAIEARVDRLGPDDLVVVLISGGGSALVPAPVAGVSLEDLVIVTEQLLSAGATIEELNTVRVALSRLKGGGLARRAAPARVHALILSDVVGGQPAWVAGGPTLAPIAAPSAARSILEARGLLGSVPGPVRARLERASAAPPAPTPRTDHAVVGDNGTSLEAVGTQLRRAGHSVEVLSRALRGEAREAATPFVDVLAGHRQHAAPRAWVAGGETTVTVTGPGRGGRNQELALAVALGAEAAGVDPHLAWVFLSGGTDGVDGPTDAAGGMVDPGSLGRMRRAGVDPRAALDANDAYRALASSGDLLRTGPTGTNVADLQVLLIGG